MAYEPDNYTFISHWGGFAFPVPSVSQIFPTLVAAASHGVAASFYRGFDPVSLTHYHDLRV